MNLLTLSWKYIVARPLNTGLNILLFAMGISIIVSLLLFSTQSEDRISKQIQGIDLVVGAKGSPLQIILCNLFHIDFPTGNIPLAEADKLVGTRYVKKAIPLALGDSYRTFRIIGTDTSYLNLYGVVLGEGSVWEGSMEAVLGFATAKKLDLKLGDTFSSQHGLDENAGDHGNTEFVVKGILRTSGTVLDNLILTSVQSIWHVHDNHGAEAGESSTVKKDTVIYSKLLPTVELSKEDPKEITSLLLQYRSPMAAVQLPRLINSRTSMQAASPAFETARLYSLLGTGIKVANWLAYTIIVIAALSIFIALFNSMKDRFYDLAIMRAMGSTKMTLFSSVLLEGIYLSLLGSVLGVIGGHGIIYLVVQSLEEASQMGLSATVFISEEWIVLATGVFVGMISAVIPAIAVIKLDISNILARGNG